MLYALASPVIIVKITMADTSQPMVAFIRYDNFQVAGLAYIVIG